MIKAIPIFSRPFDVTVTPARCITSFSQLYTISDLKNIIWSVMFSYDPSFSWKVPTVFPDIKSNEISSSILFRMIVSYHYCLIFIYVTSIFFILEQYPLASLYFSHYFLIYYYTFLCYSNVIKVTLPKWPSLFIESLFHFYNCDNSLNGNRIDYVYLQRIIYVVEGLLVPSQNAY